MQRQPTPGDVLLFDKGGEQGLRPLHVVWPPEKFPRDPGLACGYVMLAPSETLDTAEIQEATHEAAKFNGSWWVMAYKGEGIGKCRWPGEQPPQPSNGTDFRRASGWVTCSDCGKMYFDHPHDTEQLGYDSKPFLRVLCNGDRVKL
jgi:hypothetical protein